MTTAPMSRPMLRAIAATLPVATGIALAVFGAFLLLTVASLRTDRAALARPVTAAFADGALEPQASWLLGDTAIGAHQYNDCLILFQALDDRGPARLRAVSPLSVPVDTDRSCAVLEDFVDGRVQPPPRYYHQYLHGHTMLARWLVPRLGVAGLRGLYRLAIGIVLLAGIGYAMLGIARGRRPVEAAVWAVVFLAFARWFGFESFGQSLGHGPADLVPLAFLLFLARGSADAPMRVRTAVTGSALFGALTMQFEFLTGGLPLGLAIVTGAVPIATGGQGAAPVRAVVAFATAAATTAVAKLVLVATVFPAGAIGDMLHQLRFRVGLAGAVRRDTPVGWDEFRDHVSAGLEGLAPGMHTLTLGMLVLACVAGGWGYARLRGDADLRGRAGALLASMLVPPLWLVVFWQHSAEHAWFTDRILVWLIAGGAALFVLAIGARQNSRPPSGTL